MKRQLFVAHPMNCAALSEVSCIILIQSIVAAMVRSSSTNMATKARICGEVQIPERGHRLGMQYQISLLFKTNAYPLSS